jgi:PAP2 superfamily protein
VAAAVRRWLRRLDPVLQIGLLIGLAEIYRLVRTILPTDWPRAVANAHEVFHVEGVLGLDWERWLQRTFLQWPELIRGMNWFYVSSHFVVTGAFFIWLYWRNREGFALFRDGFLLATAISLFIHWRYPTAPPRLAHIGIKDTVELYSNLNIGSPHHERFANPVAAVPSLHAGWAVALGVGLVMYARSLAGRLAGVLYPSAVLLTIVVTGNHFVFDAVAGVLVMAFGFALTAPIRLRTTEPAYATATRSR